MDLSNYKLPLFSKARKDESRIELEARLAELTGWSKKAIRFQVSGDQLEQAIRYVEGYSNPKYRNLRLKEFIHKMKLK